MKYSACVLYCIYNDFQLNFLFFFFLICISIEVRVAVDFIDSFCRVCDFCVCVNAQGG